MSSAAAVLVVMTLTFGGRLEDHANGGDSGKWGLTVGSGGAS
jgi:hypothetical protein